jgi:hypothetical protein
MGEITIIFIGLIAHVFPIQGDHAALLMKHDHHKQVLVGKIGELQDVGPNETGVLKNARTFPVATLPSDFEIDAGHRVIDIERAWLRPVGEGPIARAAADVASFKDSLPSLEFLSDKQKIKQIIKDNKDSVDAIAARFYTRHGRFHVEDHYLEQATFQGKKDIENVCVAQCVAVDISATDVNGFVVLLSKNDKTGAKRAIKVKTGATIYVVNLPDECGLSGHFDTYADLLESDPGTLSVDHTTNTCPHTQKDTACALPIQCKDKGGFKLANAIDIECSSSRYP